MTDNEIIKALEICVSCASELCASECSFRPEGHCVDALLTASKDLITRQKEEIERLNQHNTVVAHKHYNDGIREFAERLKETAYTHSDITGYQSTVVDVSSIDNLVKEMVGEDNG